MKAVELETTDRRVQNNQGIFRIESSVLIGRHYECGIIILEAGVSRRHTSISRKGDQMFITDQNSLNGTFWNDKKITTIL